jgi:glycosyltransferase involved in cell wall biosynthesis
MKEGHPEKAVRVMVPGVDNHEFLASPAALAARRQRHLTGKPLRVLMTGAFSYRKGALDFTEAVRRLHGQGVEFRVVGQPSRAAYRLREELAQQIEFISRVPQDELLAHYEWADLFVFPSLEEGLAAVLWQAAAAGLPVVATQESGFEELLRRGVPGWLVPARDAGALVERIAWARDHREQLLAFMDAAHASGAIRPWRQAAEDFAGICAEVCARKKH